MAFSYSPKIVTDGLALYLDAANPYSYVSGSTNWNDVSRSQLSGSLLNGPTFNTGSGGSIVFDGVDDSCYIGEYPNLALTQLTLSIWCYPTNAEAGGQARMIAGMNDVLGWQYGYGIFTYPYIGQGPQVNFFINSGAGQDYVQYLISNNRWYNFTMTFNGTTQLAYSNGALIGTKSRTLVYDSRNRFTVGSGYLYNSPFTGNIATTSLYNRALSASEVLQNYNATKGRFGLT